MLEIKLMYDIIIIGAGVTGAACARELSRFHANVCVLEKEEDVCCGTSKANSGIIHAGYDAQEGSLMAQMNVEGNQMMPELARELEIPFQQNGSFVVCKNLDSLNILEKLYRRGLANGVAELEIITDKERIFQMEPNLAPDVEAVLYAPTAGIICPFELNLALAEHGKINGVDYRFNTEVQNIEKEEDHWKLETSQGTMEAKYIVNAAGVYAHVFHNMVSNKKINITPRRGEYLLLDKMAGNHVEHIIFALPTNLGKGVLVTPTVHGNLLVGPTAEDVEDPENIATTRAGIAAIIEKSMAEGLMSVRDLPLGQVITSFAGLRAHEEGHEFIIQEVEDAQGFIDCAGIESPGLTSCPAIGRRVANILKEKMNLVEKVDFIPNRTGVVKSPPSTYYNIICRCEMISEGEILEAIHRPLGAKSLDGIKRRVRATSGRCQGGFCSPKIMEILSRELEVDILDITKSGGNSKLLVGENKA